MSRESSKERAAEVRQMALVLFGNTRKESPGQREFIAEVLSHSLDPRMQRLAELVVGKDLTGRSISIAANAVACGISTVELANEFVRAVKSEGLIRQVQHLPDLMEQAALDAASRFEPCKDCDGTGEMKKGGACKECRGKGQVYVLGNIDRLKMIFDTYGLTSKSGGINITNVAVPPTANETLPQLAGSLTALIEGSVK